jgi:uncharacterized protein (TIGR00661 family)
MSDVKKVLIAPLNWGLGHATRCIPIIRALEKIGTDIIVAGDYPSLSVIENEFPNIPCIRLISPCPTYNSGKSSIFYLVNYLPGFLFSIIKEHRWLKKNAEKHRFDLIISDNRYGMYHHRIKSVFMGHQINLMLPEAIRFTQKFFSWINRSAIRRFDLCWIPDYEDSSQSLAGMLSRVKDNNGFYKYIGPLSRFTGMKIPNKKITYKIACILSGPEPQRTILEKIILAQLGKISDCRCIIIRGLPNSDEKLLSLPDHISYLNHASTEQMFHVIAASEVIISRTGYTSVMDLVTLNKPAILIPTPGQPEQEYLAEYLEAKNRFVIYPQSKLNILEGLEKVKHHNQNSGITHFNFLPDLNEILEK